MSLILSRLQEPSDGAMLNRRGLPMIVPAKYRPRRLQISSISLTACVVIVPFLGVLFTAPEGKSSLGPREPGQRQAGQSDSPQGEIAVPLPKGKKLILADGSFQLVREYQRQGDRVRYYSVERSAWEEIPAALVDWAATQKAEAEQDTQQKELAKQIAESEKAARFAGLDVDTSFEVRPGVFLPDDVGFYVLDGNKIAGMQQEKAELHTEKGRAVEKIITGIPLISGKQDLEISGKQAKLRIHTGDVEFYFRTADKREPHLMLLQATVKGDKRALEVISTNMVGQQKLKNREVSLLQWDAARGLYRFTVDQALQMGEYAIVETTQAEGQSQYVWTFGVDLAGNPGSPKNAGGRAGSTR
jgi:hypothetical protein